ncbi:glycosyltransferase [Leptodesmis sichuanensis]|uniref:glycosyltransferase n=1 Tax=Leptodesmis sichuanensis TaxID=2906798 RepID=UPI001F3DFD3E|nr:glycosyltransferase [Leptodesmis sichuanensis]UIE37770.1 glycosyltransferase family 1 protein [Leptodesmis sichuanensis A121]
MLQTASVHNSFITASFVPQTALLPPLPYPVYFVAKDPKWLDLIHSDELPPVTSLYERCLKDHDIWSAQAYIDLKQRGLDVHLVANPVPGQICIIPYYHLSPKDLLFKSYVVACQHDSPHPKLCEQRIVINPSRVLDSTHHFLPHRPQPNLKPRNPDRGSTIQNLVFKGKAFNLCPSFRTPGFLAELNSLGIQLITNTEQIQSDRETFAGWADYSQADVVLAVRNLTEFDASHKPALKLINAWFAGCPALLGPESAYQSLRQSDLDYIEVRTPADVIAALKYLQNNPDVYQAMVENGFQRAQEFTPDRIALAWYTLLAGPIARGYEAWLQQSPIQKHLSRPVQYLWQIAAHKLAHKQYLHRVHHGPRILSGHH